MKKTIKYTNFFCKLGKKATSFLLALCFCLTLIGFNYIVPVFAGELGQEITLTGGVSNNNYIEFYDGENLMGKILVKIGDEILTPIGNKVVLPEYTDIYQVGFYVTYEEGYEIRDVYINDEFAGLMPGDLVYYLSITSSDDLTAAFNFQELNNNSPESFEIYPILAYFSSVPEPVEMNLEGTILVPNEWISGTVSFKAQTCQVSGEVVPNDGITICDPDTETLMDLNIQGINNRNQIDYTVSGSEDNDYIIIDEGFQNYGKVGIHLTNEYINTAVDVITENLINVSAIAPMMMAYSYGLSTTDQAILTTRSVGNVSIFFGNSDVILMASGPNVIGITQVAGADYTLNSEDGSVTVSLPSLSEETITSMTLTIELLDDSLVTRQVNIIRTAIELSFDGENKRLNAGYVVHKAYLYNNQPHNDEIFDAYLQVILYRNNIVVGYRQIQIDDEELVNSLGENEGGSIESIGPEPIVLYEGEIEGVNKASVFLTNGPIDYTKNVLPSIEFGLGAGVQLEWEE